MLANFQLQCIIKLLVDLSKWQNNHLNNHGNDVESVDGAKLTIGVLEVKGVNVAVSAEKTAFEFLAAGKRPH